MSADKCKCCPGAQGPQGVPGVAGLQGMQGVAGVAGLNGLNGVNGADGAMGAQGVSGLDGAPGTQGPMGPQGAQGAQGIPGQNGANGTNGNDGAQGVPGLMGPQGVQGVPGDCVNCCGDNHPEFAEVYSILPQTLSASPGSALPGQVVLMENTIYSTANIDVSQASTSGLITVNLAGWYDVTIGVTASINPIPSPLPVWTVSLFQNNLLVAGSTFANLPLSAVQQANECVSDVFIHCAAGDVLQVCNTSTSELFLSSPSLGTNAIVNSATFKIQLLQAD